MFRRANGCGMRGHSRQQAVQRVGYGNRQRCAKAIASARPCRVADGFGERDVCVAHRADDAGADDVAHDFPMRNVGRAAPGGSRRREPERDHAQIAEKCAPWRARAFPPACRGLQRNYSFFFVSLEAAGSVLMRILRNSTLSEWHCSPMYPFAGRLSSAMRQSSFTFSFASFSLVKSVI